MAGSVVSYIIEPHPMSSSSMVFTSWLLMGLPRPLDSGAYSVSENRGMLMMPMGALGTAASFFPSLYFSMVLRSVQYFSVGRPHSLMGAS